MIIIAKILVSVIVVVILAEISKRINPLIGGILNGLPLGTGLSVYFIAADKGPDYILSGIPWGIAALSASLMFCLTYFLTGKWFQNKKNYRSMLVSSAAGIAVFLLTGLLIKRIDLSIISSTAIFILFYLANIFIIKKVYTKNNEIRNEKNSSFRIVLFRGLIVSVIILILTSIASILGSEWAGILSSFPSTLYALILILQYEEGNILYPSVIYGFSYGIINLLFFYILCYFLLPLFGLNLTYLMVYFICFGMIILFHYLKKFIKSSFISQKK